MNKNHDKSRISGMLALGLSVLLGLPAFALTKFEQLTSDAEAAYKNRNYPDAQKFFEMAIKETDKLEKNDKRVPTTYYNLALVFQAEANYAEAEKNMTKALDMMTVLYGTEHQRVAQVYMDLADLYLEQAGVERDKAPELKKKSAENYKKGLEIFEKIYSQATGQEEGSSDVPQPKEPGKKSDKPTPQSTAADLSNALRLVADFYAEDEIYDQAEPLYKRSLELEDFAAGPDDKDLGKHKAKVAEFYCVQGKYKLADPLFKDALANAEKNYGVDGVETARICYNFGGLYYDQGQFGDAEVMFKRSLKILEKAEDQNEDDLAQKSIALADVLDMQGKNEESTVVYKKAIATLEKSSDKQVLIRGLKQYQKHLLMQNKKDEAAKIAARIKTLKDATKAQ